MMTHTGTFVVESEHGLHAREAAVLVGITKTFKAEIEASVNGISANAKSILDLLALGADKGDHVLITANGSDAEEAVHAVMDKLNSRILLPPPIAVAMPVNPSAMNATNPL